MAAGEPHVLSVPFVDAWAWVSVGHQHVQAGLALGQHALMALLQLGQWLFVVGRDHRHPWDLIAQAALQAAIVDQLAAGQLGGERCLIGAEAVVVSGEGCRL